MRFTSGYWMMRPEITPTFAVEYVRHGKRKKGLRVLAATRRITGRGDTLNSATVTVDIDSPMPEVIRVRVAHHLGERRRGPHFELYEQPCPVEIADEADAVSLTSGALRARVDKGPGDWSVSFWAGDRLVTRSGFRGMAHMLNRDTGRRYMVDSLDMDVGECVYGLGERFTPYVKNGQTVDMWNEDGGTSSEIAYKNVPFFMSNRGYGVFVNHPTDVSFEVMSEKVARTQFSVEGEALEYLVIYGPTPLQVLDRYTALTGRPALPPAWSFGLWLTTSFTTSYDEETVTSFIQGMADRDIPLHVFHFDCFWMQSYQWCDFTWDPHTFPDPEQMLARYKAMGLKICMWINPYIAQHTEAFEEGMAHGYLIAKTDGSVWQTDMWQAGMGLVDFTNPAAWAWYQQKLKALLEQGVDCFKTDFGERVPVRDIAYHDGSDPVAMHNYYTFLYNQCVFELLERELGAGEAVLFARSATAGGQQFPVHWGGDCSATYPSMAETLRGGLSLAQSGFGFWSHDISGFEQTAPPDVYKRWCAFGLLSSHSRLHGSTSYRVPWLFGEEACDVLRHFLRLKCALMPYLYQMAREAHLRGAPMLRPMAMQFPDDPGCDALDQQYMLGDSLLVAPVMRADGGVTYYLPEGEWTHFADGRRVEGKNGRWMREEYDFFGLPLWVPDGAAIAVGANEARPDYDYARGVTLHVFPMAEGVERRVEIPALNGSVSKTFVICRTGNTLTVTPGDDRPYRLLLRGMRPARAVSADWSELPLGMQSRELTGVCEIKL
ncbi:MAG: alpha-xylosidase [Clostridia bacterium]|nr:alpha-xylosidase [Clostridia bacterium]